MNIKNKNVVKLSDLPIPGIEGSASLMTSEELEIQQAKTTYNSEMQSKKAEIKTKIQDLESKLNKHNLKEGMLDRIILQTYTELENLGSNDFTRRGQKQTVLIKQLEALGLLHDTMMKYEDMIQKYHKIIMDIDNNQFNGFIKINNLKKEEKVTDEGIGAVLMELQQILKGDSSSGDNPLLEELKKELTDSDY